MNQLPAVAYVSDCKCGETFTWGFDDGATKANMITKTCDSHAWEFANFKERIKVDA